MSLALSNCVCSAGRFPELLTRIANWGSAPFAIASGMTYAAFECPASPTRVGSIAGCFLSVLCTAPRSSASASIDGSSHPSPKVPVPRLS